MHSTHLIINCVSGDVDYRLPSMVDVIFSVGMQNASINVPIIDDNIKESEEDFYAIINLDSLPNDIIIGQNCNITVTIVDNDSKYIASTLSFCLLKIICVYTYSTLQR